MATRWSVLGSVGSSNVARVTVLAPFIGYLIIYNQWVSQYFTLSAPLNDAMLGSSIDFFDAIYLRRLDLLYFGLVLLGTGVGFFGFLAPASVKNERDMAKFVERMMTFNTPLNVRYSLIGTVGKYFRCTRGEQRSSFFNFDPISFPSNVSGLLHQFVEQLYVESNIGLFEADDESDIDSLSGPNQFRTGSGYIDTAAIMEAMNSERAVDRVYWASILQASEANPRDVFVLEYLSDDFSNGSLRVLISVFVILGFVLLVLPTIASTAIIMQSWFS